MIAAVISSKGQITIPKKVRQSLHLHTGDKVAFEISGSNEAVIKPVTKSAAEVFGMLHKPGRKIISVEEMNKAIAERQKKF